MKDSKFAVIKLGGKQHLVRENDIIEVNRLENEENKAFEIDEVLLVQNNDDISIGTPNVEGAKVSAKVVEHAKGEKINMMKYKSKSRYRKRKGHRQHISKIQITKISS
ncbi:MAG TPA: 50S ribosomal protein L21 [Candidatus Dojkabacteria bacterium]|jgi:large subunit ribosomal protein L21